MTEPETASASNGFPTRQLILLAQAVRFYSRIPIPKLPFEADPHALPDFSLLPRLLPLAAIVIALPCVATLVLCRLAGLPPMLTAGFAIAVLVFSTGAFHEDGLADAADGLFGGTTPERRLEIMKDSRIGSYGALAIVFSLLLRVIALGEIIGRDGSEIAAGIILATAAVSRTAGLLPLVLLSPARRDGASASVGRPAPKDFFAAAALTVGVALVCIVGTEGPPAVLIGMLMAAAAIGWAVARLAQRLIGGQTGDIAGTAQQLVEIACLTSAVALASTGS